VGSGGATVPPTARSRRRPCGPRGLRRGGARAPVVEAQRAGGAARGGVEGS
jgi:hypothetical protein